MKIKNIKLAAIVSILAISGTAIQADRPKVGFIYVGPISDHGWTYQHDVARRAVEQAGYETTYVESVPEGADAERAIRQLAVTGHNPIFTTSFGYMDPTNKIAEEFPNVRFEHATGYKRAPNVSTYNIRFYEGRYVIGRMAGQLTKSNKIGYIGAFPIPEVVRGINSAILGARSVNPDTTIHVIWVNSWFDPGKEAAAAQSLIDQGIDVIMQHTDSPAPMQTADEKGIWAFGQASNMAKYGKNSHATALVNNWSDYYIQRVKEVELGTWREQDIWGGFASGMIQMGPYHNSVDPDIIDDANKTVNGIKSGSLHPFTGPIKDRDGTTRIPRGQTADDGLLLGMDFYVEGVVGTLPN